MNKKINNLKELVLVNEVKEVVLNKKRRYCCYRCSVDGFCPTYDCRGLDKIKAYTDRQWLNAIKKVKKTYGDDMDLEELVFEVIYEMMFKKITNKKKGK